MWLLLLMAVALAPGGWVAPALALLGCCRHLWLPLGAGAE